MKPNDTAKLFRDCLRFIQAEESNDAETRDLVLSYVTALEEDKFFKPHIKDIYNKAQFDNTSIISEENKKTKNLVKDLHKFLRECTAVPSKDHLKISKKLLAFISVCLICNNCIPPEWVKSFGYGPEEHPPSLPVVTSSTDLTHHLSSAAQPSDSVQPTTREYINRGLPLSHQRLPDKYILTFAISAKATELMKELTAHKQLTPENFLPLFKSREWIHYAPEDQWKRTCEILFETRTKALVEDDHDVRYVTIKMDAHDDRFEKTSNMMKLYDALSELAQQKPALRLSERHPKESYENKGFFRV